MRISIGKKKYDVTENVISGKELKSLANALESQVYFVVDDREILIEDDHTVALLGDEHFKLKK